MELTIGLFALGFIVALCVVGWWRYYLAVQAAAVERRWTGAQIDTLWRALQAQAAERAAQARRDAWAGEVLESVTKEWGE